MATHTIEIGNKPYIQAEIKKLWGRYFLLCYYSESKKGFIIPVKSSDFSDWLEEEQIDEATVLLYDQLQEWCNEVDADEIEQSELEAKDWEDTKKHINDNWSNY